MSSSKRNPDIQANSDPDLTERPMRRKRKVESEAPDSAAAAGPAALDVAGTSSPAPDEDADDPQVARGQPLKDFVENWEFRWDVQRDLYPWEARSKMSDLLSAVYNNSVVNLPLI